jgi:tellurite methyltransferase
MSMKSFLTNSSGWKSGNILDVRPEGEFRLGHLRGAVSHPLEVRDCGTWSADFLERKLPSIFLPPRHDPLLVVAAELKQARAVADHLKSRGRAVVEYSGWDQENCPAEHLARGHSTNHLWSPPQWLVEHEALLPPPAAGPVLDLACGSGRALVWLAEKGYRTVGIDWQPEALALARVLADSRDVVCDFQSADLRDTAQVPSGPWSIVLNFRFLHRELLDSIPALLQPGGVALVRTFRQVAGYEGHPHKRHRLVTGELLRAFPAASCEILAHEEGFDPDGRPAAGLVARRRLI